MNSDVLCGNVCGHTFLMYVNFYTVFDDFPFFCDGWMDELTYLCSVI